MELECAGEDVGNLFVVMAVEGDVSAFGEEDVKAYVQLAAGVELESAAVVSWCEEWLSYFKVPRYVEFVDEFPRTVTKREIERHVLRQRGIGDAWDAGERRRRPAS